MSQIKSLCLDTPPLGEGGLSKLFSWRNDPRIYKWCRQYEPISWHQHESYWEKVQKDPNIKMYGIRDGNNLVGVCGLTSIDWVNRRAEFSLYIASEYQGNGYGEAALRLLVEHGFNVLNLNSIWGEAFDGNPAINMFKKVGFIEEGRRRQFYFREGKYIDAILFSLMRSEYAMGAVGSLDSKSSSNTTRDANAPDIYRTLGEIQTEC